MTDHYEHEYTELDLNPDINHCERCQVIYDTKKHGATDKLCPTCVSRTRNFARHVARRSKVEQRTARIFGLGFALTLIASVCLASTNAPPRQGGFKRCTGAENCDACTSCSSCKHCSKNGGSCGVKKKQEQQQKKGGAK